MSASTSIRRFSAVLLFAALSALGPAACDEPYVPRVPGELNSFFQQLQDDALRFPFRDGAWGLQYGDSPFYGTAFYVRAGHSYDVARYRDIAARAKAYDLTVLEHAARDRSWFLANLEEVLMAGFGLLEYAAQTGETDVVPPVDDLIDTVNSLTNALGGYINVDAGMFAIKTYGPTAITGAVALLNLQYASYIHNERRAERVQYARDIAEIIREKAFDGQRYRVKPGDDQLELYPNTMMMLVLCRLYEQTGDASYRDTAMTAFDGIQPLKNRTRGGYNSPYSAKDMGAKTDDYSTLSSQNYLSLALLVLYENTGEPRYFQEALSVMRFVRTRLYDAAQGRILHHFIDGRIALPSDPEYFCTGCNLQFLYVLWYLKEHVGQPSSTPPVPPESPAATSG